MEEEGQTWGARHTQHLPPLLDLTIWPRHVLVATLPEGTLHTTQLLQGCG